MELLPLSDFIPEILLCGIAVLVILSDIIGLKKVIFFLVLTGLLSQLFFLDNVFKVIMCFAAIVTVLISGREQRMEYYLLILSVLLGANLLATSTSLIMILLSMEMISLSSYVLTAGTIASERRAEAAWKFFIYGSAATAVMIFGMTYMYGTTGKLEIDFPVNGLGSLGSLMILAGFLFKMTAAPFHLWAPDVYEATPAPIIAFLSVVPKLAAFVLIANSPFQPFAIASVAIFTIIVGTLAAFNQSNAKRMMAYSSVVQAGFFLALIFSSQGLWQYYAAVFAIMNYAVFIVIHTQEQSGRGTAFADFNGIGYINPLAAVAITLGLVSLVGLPPMAGFMAKLFVFTSIWGMFTESQNPVFLTLFVTGLLATAASLYFYLKIPFYAFFRRTESADPIKIPLTTNLLLIILVGLLLALFLAPGLLMG